MSVKTMLRTLHWLPVKARIEFKIALLCFNALNSQSPDYIKELFVPYTPIRQLRSSDSHLLAVPRTNLKFYGDRSLSKIGPTIWNSLPLALRLSGNADTFKKGLKTHLFQLHLS